VSNRPNVTSGATAPAPVLSPMLAAELFEQSLLVVPTLDLRDIGARLLAPLVNATATTRASLMIVNPQTGRLRVVAGLGIPTEVIGRDTTWRPNSISEWVFRKRQGLVLNGKVGGDGLEGTSEESIESAMCLPLETDEGVIGVLNLARMHPSPVFTDAEMNELNEMLAPVAGAIERACHVNRSEELAQQLRRSSGLTGRTMFKPGRYEARNYDLGFLRIASALEGGDVCERVAHATGGHSLVAVDTSGDGVDAVLAASFIQGLFVGIAAAERSASGMVARLNAEMFQRLGGETTAALWTAQLSPSGQISSCNAGYPTPLWVPSDDSPVVRLASGGPYVGAAAQSRWDEEQVQLLPGDIVLAVSDGVVNACNVTGQVFGEERLIEVAVEMRRQPLDALSAEIVKAVRDWTGRPVPTDDLTVLAVRYTPGE